MDSDFAIPCAKWSHDNLIQHIKAGLNLANDAVNAAVGSNDMNLVKWLRKNNKKIMAVVVIVIMFGFIGGSALRQISRRGTETFRRFLLLARGTRRSARF